MRSRSPRWTAAKSCRSASVTSSITPNPRRSPPSRSRSCGPGPARGGRRWHAVGAPYATSLDATRAWAHVNALKASSVENLGLRNNISFKNFIGSASMHPEASSQPASMTNTLESTLLGWSGWIVPGLCVAAIVLFKNYKPAHEHHSPAHDSIDPSTQERSIGVPHRK